MSMSISRCKQLVFSRTGVLIVASTPLARGCALEILQILAGHPLQTLSAKLGLKAGDQAANVLVRPAEVVVDCILGHEGIGILFAQAVLNSLADDHIAQQRFVCARARYAAANPDKKGKFQARIAGPEAGGGAGRGGGARGGK